MGLKRVIKLSFLLGAVLIFSLMAIRTVFFRLGIHSSLFGVCPANTISASIVDWPDTPLLPIPEQLSLGNEVIERFRDALRFKTISTESGNPPAEQLVALIDFLQRGL